MDIMRKPRHTHLTYILHNTCVCVSVFHCRKGKRKTCCAAGSHKNRPTEKMKKRQRNLVLVVSCRVISTYRFSIEIRPKVCNVPRCCTYAIMDHILQNESLFMTYQL